MDKHYPQSDSDLIDLVDRYLSGEASDEEARLAVSLLSKAPRVEGILRGDDIVSAPDWNALYAKVSKADPVPVLEFQRSTRSVQITRVSGKKYYRWAAGIAAAALIAVGGWWSGVGSLRHNLASQLSTYATAAGKQSQVTLPDGSKVLLNVASTLEIPGDFMNGNRTVRLKGEAMFEVVHHASTPFRVQTANAVTQVLGTEFAVRAYPDDPQAMMSVREGRVSVDNVVVSAGERLVIPKGSKADRTRLTDLSGSNSFAFTSGEISFDDVTLEVAATELERWFDITIHFADPELKAHRISGEFSARSIMNLIDVMEGTFGVRATVSGNKVTISKR